MKLLVLLQALFLAVGFSVDFENQKIRIKNKTVLAEIADTDSKRQQGLMFRKTLKDGRGMLFIFENERELGFWMKNTFVPLSIGYFDESGKLLEVLDMEPAVSEIVAETKVYRSTKPARYALEVPRGWYERNRIKVGDQLDLSSIKKSVQKK